MTGTASCCPRLDQRVSGRDVDVSAAAHSLSAPSCVQEMNTGARRRAHSLHNAVSDADGVSRDMKESLAYVMCTAGAASLFPPGLPRVKLSATGQGCLLSRYRQLGARGLRSRRVHWTLDHLCSWSVARNLLEYMAHQLTLTPPRVPYTQCRDQQTQCEDKQTQCEDKQTQCGDPQTQCGNPQTKYADQQIHCQVSTAGHTMDTARPQMDDQQYHVREAGSNVTTTVLQGTNMDTYQCHRNEQCSNVTTTDLQCNNVTTTDLQCSNVTTTESRGPDSEHQTCENSSRRCHNLGRRNPTRTVPRCWPLGLHKMAISGSEIHSNRNVNNGSDTEGKDNEQDFLTAESPLAASFMQAAGFMCDSMDTPTVLSSAHHVYHLASDPPTHPVGSEGSGVDSRLLTCLVRKDDRPISAATRDNSSACQLAPPTSCSQECEDLLSTAMSIAGLGDTDDVCSVDFLTEYPVKVEGWFPGFPEEDGRLVESVSQQPSCLDPSCLDQSCLDLGSADCAMLHMCAGLTLDVPPISESGAQTARDNAQSNPGPGCTYIWADPQDAFSHLPDSFSHYSDSFSYYADEWSQRPEALNGGTEAAVGVCSHYEPHNPELEPRHTTSGTRQQRSLSDVMDTCLQVPGPAHSAPWSGRHSVPAGEQCTFTQDVVVVKQVLELLPDTELWAEQSTEGRSQHADMWQCCAANSGTSVPDIKGPPALSHTQHAEPRTPILKRDETSTRLKRRGKQLAVENKQALVGTNRGGTCLVTSPSADYIPTPGVPFSARSLCPVLQAPLTRRKSRRGRTTKKCIDSASMPARGRPKGSARGRGRSAALGGGCSRKRKCPPEPSKHELDTHCSNTQTDKTGEMEGKKASGHVGSKKPTSRRCSTTAGKTLRANMDSSQGRGIVSAADTDTACHGGLVHPDLVGYQAVAGQGFTWQTSLGTLAMDATGQPQVRPIEAVGPATEVGAMTCSVTESSREAEPVNISVTESSREAEPVNISVTESSRESGASSLSRFLQARGTTVARFTQEVTLCTAGFLQCRRSGRVRGADPGNVSVTENSREAEPATNSVTESSREVEHGNVIVTENSREAEPGIVSVTENSREAESATNSVIENSIEAEPVNVSVTESSRESGASSLSRFLQARGATVARFTQQVTLCSTGFLQCRRSGRVREAEPVYVSVTESSREAEPGNVSVTENSREAGPATNSVTTSCREAEHGIVIVTEYIREAEPGIVSVAENSRETEPGNVSVTENSREAEPATNSVTESSREAEPGNISVTESNRESGASSLSRFLQARGATVARFTQQVSSCSPGILKGRRSGRVDNFRSRKTILTRLPKQVQHARSVQLRQASSLKNSARGRAPRPTIRDPGAVDTDFNNHANYPTAKPMSSRESKGKHKTFSKQASADGRQTNVHRRDGDGKLVLGGGRPDRQTREEAERRVQLPSIGPGKTVSFLESTAVPAQKPVLAMSGSQRQTPGSTLFSIILEQLRASTDIANPETASPPRTQRQAPADPSQGPGFLPQIHPQCVRKVTATDVSKTAVTQELNTLGRSAANHDHLTTNVNNSRVFDHQVTTSRNTLITRRTQQTAARTQLNLKKAASHRQMSDPLGEKAASHRQMCEPLGEKAASHRQMCDPLGEKVASHRQLCEPLGEKAASHQQMCEPLGEKAASHRQMCDPLGEKEMSHRQMCDPLGEKEMSHRQMCDPLGEKAVSHRQMCDPLGEKEMSHRQMCDPLGEKAVSHRQMCEPLGEKAASHRQMCDPFGEKAQTVLVRSRQHTDRDKHQTGTQPQTRRSHVKPVTIAGAARQTSAQLDNGPVLPSTRPSGSRNTSPGGSRNARSQLSKRKYRTSKRDKPPKTEIAETVRRLTVRPPSNNSRLAIMIGNWEREYGQPLSLNQQPGQLVEASTRRHLKPSSRTSARPSRKVGESHVSSGSPVAHSPVQEERCGANQTPSVLADPCLSTSPAVSESETSGANQTPSVLADPCLGTSPAVSESHSSQGPGPGGQYGGDDGPESIQLDFSPH